MLMPDIQLTATLVCNVTDKLTDADHERLKDLNLERPLSESLEERYLKVMKALQFGKFIENILGLFQFKTSIYYLTLMTVINNLSIIFLIYFFCRHL